MNIQCPQCGLLFGKETARGTLEIKHRDVFRKIKGDLVTVEGPCRRCGTVVTWRGSV